MCCLQISYNIKRHSNFICSSRKSSSSNSNRKPEQKQRQQQINPRTRATTIYKTKLPPSSFIYGVLMLVWVSMRVWTVDSFHFAKSNCVSHSLISRFPPVFHTLKKSVDGFLLPLSWWLLLLCIMTSVCLCISRSFRPLSMWSIIIFISRITCIHMPFVRSLTNSCDFQWISIYVHKWMV